MSGYLISFEGIDGAGKSTHIAPLAEMLKSRGLDVVVTREPGGTPLAEKLRALLLHEDMDPLTEVLIAFAARKDHIEKVIRPALEAGKVVICDRFTDSTIAYQGYGKGSQDLISTINTLEKIVQRSPEDEYSVLNPDLTLWFDIDPVLAAQRMSGRSSTDRFDSQEATFFEKVRYGYLVRSAAQRFVHIDAERRLDQVWDDVAHAVTDFLAKDDVPTQRPAEVASQ